MSIGLSCLRACRPITRKDNIEPLEMAMEEAPEYQVLVPSQSQHTMTLTNNHL